MFPDIVGDAWLRASVVERRLLDATTQLTWLRLDVVPEVAAAGQYVQVAVAGAAGAPVVRAVSLASPPGQRAELLVARAQTGAEQSELCSLQLGAEVAISRVAAGRLTLQSVPSRPVLWLLAAGTGLSPLRAIVAEGADLGRFGRVVLVHSVRAPTQLAFGAELRAAHDAGRLTYVPMCTGGVCAQDVEGSLWQGLPRLWGRIPAAIEDGSLAVALGVGFGDGEAAVLICGGGAMVSATREVLERGGLRRHVAPLGVVAGGGVADLGLGTIVTEF